MKISITHAALYTKDLERSKEFYCTYFRGICNPIYKNAKGFSSYFLTFDSGARLELMHREDLEEREVIDSATGYNHLCFSVGSKEAVIELTNQITEDGYQLYSAPRETGDGYFESAIGDPDGNRIEITL